MWGWDLNPSRLIALMEPLSYWSSWCFDPLVREKLTVTFFLPRGAQWAAGRTGPPTTDSLTSSSNSESYRRGSPQALYVLPWLP